MVDGMLCMQKVQDNQSLAASLVKDTRDLVFQEAGIEKTSLEYLGATASPLSRRLEGLMPGLAGGNFLCNLPPSELFL